MINDVRLARGLSELKWDSRLARCAALMAVDQSDQDELSHVDRKGRNFRKRVQDSVQPFPLEARENLGCGSADQDVILDAWLDSLPHRENLLAPKLDSIGVAFENRQNKKPVWAVVFARTR